MTHKRQQLKRFARHMRNNPTDPEHILWQHLKNRTLHGHRFIRQYVIDNYIIDFVCPKTKLAVELDGGQHDQQRRADTLRTQHLNQNGYTVIRFWNDQISTNLEGVLHTIAETIIQTKTGVDTHVPFRSERGRERAKRDRRGMRAGTRGQKD